MLSHAFLRISDHGGKHQQGSAESQKNPVNRENILYSRKKQRQSNPNMGECHQTRSSVIFFYSGMCSTSHSGRDRGYGTIRTK